MDNQNDKLSDEELNKINGIAFVQKEENHKIFQRQDQNKSNNKSLNIR